MRSSTHTVAIVGAGFSGAVVAMHLLKHAAQPTRVVLFESGPDLARGVAYRRHSYPYLLNVPVARMAAFPGAPDDFLNFARQRQPGVAATDFVSREWYGDYLEQHLRSAAAQAPENVVLEVMQETVEAVRALPDGRWQLSGNRWGVLAADDVVLATGHAKGAAWSQRFDAVCADPWLTDPRTVPAGPVLVVGSALTMADWVCAASRADPNRQIYVVSRHGLLPHVQTEAGSGAVVVPGLDGELQAARTLREMTRVVRRYAREVSDAGGDWRDVVAQVRHRVPHLWARLADADRTRFLRHVRPYWDIHRHRLPESVAAALTALCQQGRLVVAAGRIEAIATDGSDWRVAWRRRGGGERIELSVVRVIDCTGMDGDIGGSDQALWRQLVADGLAVADPARTGVVTDGDLQLIGRAGTPRRGLYYLGPLLRAGSWEATAVPELRGRAAELACRLLARTA